MKFSYNWLSSFFNKKLPSPNKLAEILTFHSFEVESIEKVKNDYVLNIDVLPNRASDCFSHFGIAREISALLKIKILSIPTEIKENRDFKTKDFISLKVDSKEDCLRYTARLINSVKVNDSPAWLKQRLESCGVKPINCLVDIANYVMLELGQPLHVFDATKIEGGMIIVRRAKKGEKINALDGVEYVLDNEVLVIADKNKPIAIAGIKGGANSGISEKTTSIVLESANFERTLIRKSSNYLKLKTDASLRFEQGLDPNLAEFALDRAAFLIQKIAGGKVASGKVDFYPKKRVSALIRLDLDYLRSLLGIEISESEVSKILSSLNFGVSRIKKEKELMVTVPTYRLDVKSREDLVEEVGRIYGYEKIESKNPAFLGSFVKNNLNFFWEDFVRNILKGVGFTEVYNYSFISQKDKDFLKLKNIIELENPISSDFSYLRPSLLINLLKNIFKSQRDFSNIDIFEIGKAFSISNNYVFENNKIAIVSNHLSFYEAKGVIDLIFEKMGITDDIIYKNLDNKDNDFFDNKKGSFIFVNGKEIGYLGLVSQRVLQYFKIKDQIVAIELNFDEISKIASEDYEYRPISKYPAAIRDLSILIPVDVKVESVLSLIQKSGGDLVKDVDLFDIYEGDPLPEGKKSLAFRIVYQSYDKTLNSDEVNNLHNKIINELIKNKGWEVR
jgi:phenylalanyl-tRNA synthetase beta chain